MLFILKDFSGKNTIFGLPEERSYSLEVFTIDKIKSIVNFLHDQYYWNTTISTVMFDCYQGQFMMTISPFNSLSVQFSQIFKISKLEKFSNWCIISNCNFGKGSCYETVIIFNLKIIEIFWHFKRSKLQGVPFRKYILIDTVIFSDKLTKMTFRPFNFKNLKFDHKYFYKCQMHSYKVKKGFQMSHSCHSSRRSVS